ncbi:MAG TPA: PQQ-binding-like beta-propeller repeat protein [Chloroflexota bacterium]|nr:PQQ-binding-like beta-propeller repeat protein [Chloroflexota bacterium]
MRKRWGQGASRWLTALAVAGACWLTPATALADGPAPGSPWPQLKRDGPRSGIGGANGPSNPTVAWSYNSGSAIVSGPVIASDGTIYIGMENFRVQAVAQGGSRRWEYVLPDSGGGRAPTYLLINQKDRIVFGTDNGYFVGLQTDGKEDWKFDTRNAPYGDADPQAIRSAPGAAANYGRVYFGTDEGLLYELEDGSFAGIRRSEADGAIKAGAGVSPDGTLIWAAGRALRAGSATGGDKWRVVLDGTITATPAIGRDSTTYAATENGSVYAVATDGQVRWQVRPGAGRRFRGSPALGPDGTVYVGGDEGRLFALDPANGSVKWSFGTGDVITTAPAVGGNGLIYLGGNDGRLYVLTPTGQEQARFQADGPIEFSSPAIGSNGMLYIGTRNGTLYALREGAPLPQPTATPGPSTAAAPAGFSFVRCASGRVYTLNANGAIGEYVSTPAQLGSNPHILQASDTVPQGLVDAVCGPGR